MTKCGWKELISKLPIQPLNLPQNAMDPSPSRKQYQLSLIASTSPPPGRFGMHSMPLSLPLTGRQTHTAPTPDLIKDEEEYKVDQILDSRKHGRGSMLRPSSRHSQSQILVSKDMRVRAGHISVNPACCISKWTKSQHLV